MQKKSYVLGACGLTAIIAAALLTRKEPKAYEIPSSAVPCIGELEEYHRLNGQSESYAL